MPTGYTVKIHDGKEVDAKEFIMDCSRAFGALVMMRDQPSDSPIPDRFEPDTYTLKRANECKNQLSRVQSLTEEEALSEMEEWYQDKCEREFKNYQESVAMADRYKHTLEQVEKWNPPTDEHTELKNFCIKQLDESIRFDCRRAFEPYIAPEKPSLDTWTTDRIEGLKSEIAYYEKSYQEEVERTEKRNEWIKQLRDSLQGFA